MTTRVKLANTKEAKEFWKMITDAAKSSPKWMDERFEASDSTESEKAATDVKTKKSTVAKNSK